MTLQNRDWFTDALASAKICAERRGSTAILAGIEDVLNVASDEMFMVAGVIVPKPDVRTVR